MLRTTAMGLGDGLRTRAARSGANSGAPVLNLDFVSMTALGLLDSRLTFSRASNATMFDAQGRLVWAPANMVERSTPVPGTDPGWKVQPGVVGTTGQPSWDGSNSAVLFSHTDGRNFEERNRTWQGPHTLSGYFRAVSNVTGIGLWMEDGGGSPPGYVKATLSGAGSVTASGAGVTGGIVSVGNGWYRVWVNYPFASAVSLRCCFGAWETGVADAFGFPWFNSGGAPRQYLAADIQLERTGPDSPKPILRNPGSTTGVFGPRFTHNPATGAPQGLVLEGYAWSNLVERSAPATPNWSLINATLTTGQLIGLDRTTATASKISETSATGQHLTFSNGRAGTADRVTGTAVLKQGERRYAYVQLSDLSTGALTATIDLQTGAVTSSNLGPIGPWLSGAAVRVEDYGDGWWNVILTGERSASANPSVLAVGTNEGPGSPGNFAGTTGHGVFCDYTSLNAGITSTAALLPIPTFGFARANATEEIARFAAPWASQAFTILFEFQGFEEYAFYCAPFCVSDGGYATNEVTPYTTQGNGANVAAELKVASSNIFVASPLPAPGRSVYRLAVRVQANNYVAAAQGSIFTAGQSALFPLGMQWLSLLGDHARGGGTRIPGIARRVRVWNTGLSNAELQALTA